MTKEICVLKPTKVVASQANRGTFHSNNFRFISFFQFPVKGGVLERFYAVILPRYEFSSDHGVADQSGAIRSSVSDKFIRVLNFFLLHFPIGNNNLARQ